MSKKYLPATIEKQSSDFLTKFSESLAGYAERNYSKDSFFKSIQLAILESEQLQECFKTDAGKASLFHALRFAATTGLSLNPQEGKAALIAYGGKVSYQVMKNGLLDLAMESGMVEFIISETVRENDRWGGVTKTMSGDTFELTIAITNRGNIIGFMAGIKMKTGSTHVSYMTIDEVEDHRDRYAKGLYYTYDNKQKGIKSGDIILTHAWHKSFEGMALKTVIKRLFRNISISKDIDKVIGADDGYESETITIPADGYSAEDAKVALEKKVEPEKEKPVVEDDSGSLL